MNHHHNFHSNPNKEREIQEKTQKYKERQEKKPEQQRDNEEKRQQAINKITKEIRTSNGIALRINKAAFPRASIINKNRNYIAARITNDMNKFMIIVAIHAPTDPKKNNKSWKQLEKEILTPHHNEPIIIGGDLNAVVDFQEDRDSKSNNTYDSKKIFRETMEKLNMNDLWREEHPEEKQYTYFKIQINTKLKNTNEIKNRYVPGKSKMERDNWKKHSHKQNIRYRRGSRSQQNFHGI